MHDLIYHKGRVVAHIDLGSVFAGIGNAKLGAVSGGKIYSVNGQMLGSFRSASDPSPEKSLSASFCAVLNIAA